METEDSNTENGKNDEEKMEDDGPMEDFLMYMMRKGDSRILSFNRQNSCFRKQSAVV